MGESEGDQSIVTDAEKALFALKPRVAETEIETLLSGEADANDAYLQINAGAGGTESQDWAGMLQRMYTRWAERHGMNVELIDYHAGEQAGIKSATLLVKGENLTSFADELSTPTPRSGTVTIGSTNIDYARLNPAEREAASGLHMEYEDAMNRNITLFHAPQLNSPMPCKAPSSSTLKARSAISSSSAPMACRSRPSARRSSSRSPASLRSCPTDGRRTHAYRGPRTLSKLKEEWREGLEGRVCAGIAEHR